MDPIIDYSEIKKWLEHGDLEKIAKEHRIDPGHGGKMLKGLTKSIRVDFVAAVIAKAADHKSRITESMNRLKQA